MLRNISAIDGYSIAASDGHLGVVSDFLFDDATWLVRWVVVDTGKWLSGRQVLLPPSVLGHLNSETREFIVRLTKQQVKDSPDIDSAQTVSRQMESSLYDYYGWNPYWGDSFYLGGYSYIPRSAMVTTEAERLGLPAAALADKKGDPHLRSAEAVTGYHIHATDGEIGHIEDFLLEDADWSIHYLVVDTKNWWPAKKVLISPKSAKEINWTDRLVNLDVSREKVKASPTYDAETILDRAYERDFHRHYGAGKPGSAFPLAPL